MRVKLGITTAHVGEHDVQSIADRKSIVERPFL